MTGPKDPDGHDGEDWGFPDVDPAGPASVQLPAPEPEAPFDTGSDAWWRAQATAQRAAAGSDPVPAPAEAAADLEPPEPEPPPELVAPQVLVAAPSPLDREWAPSELPGLSPTEVLPVVPDAVHPPPAVTEEAPAAPDQGFAAVEPEPIVDRTPRRATPPAPAATAAAAAVAPATPALAAAAVAAAAPTVEASYTEPVRPRSPHEGQRVGPARAAAGAAIAVAGVGLAIGALFLFGKGDPKGSPAVSLPPTASATAAASAPATPLLPNASSAPTASAPPAAVVPPVVTPRAVAPVVPVTVLNNSRIKGLADRAASRFRAGGWPVPATGNYRGGRIVTTTVYYPAGGQGSAQRFAAQFGIGRVLPRFAGLPGSGLTVVLTRDYRS